MNRKHQIKFEIENVTIIRNAFNTVYYMKNENGYMEEISLGKIFFVNITEEGKYTLEDKHHRLGFWYVQYFEEKNGKVFMTLFDEVKFNKIGRGKK